MNATNSPSFFNRWLMRAWMAGLAVLLVYICIQPDIAWLGTHNPISTSLMELRHKQAKKAKIRYPAVMIWKNLDEISPYLVHAILIAEDDRFYQHHGFDLEEIWE